MKIVDLTHLNWGTTHNGGATYGCYYKATEIKNGVKYYYKCSQFYKGQNVFGDEAVNEVICSRFLKLLGFNVAKYTLIKARIKLNGSEYITYVCKSQDFAKGRKRLSFEDLHSILGGTVENLISDCNLSVPVQRMIVADFLILQRDRHGKNIEVFDTNKGYELAPLFDNGLALLAPYPSQLTKYIKDFDVLADYPVNNYIGARSLYSNLAYIKKPIVVKCLTKDDKKSIMYGIGGALPREYIDKIWELLTYRYYFLRKRGIIVCKK